MTAVSDQAEATITGARLIGGHDGRAEILVELTYPGGGTTTLALDEEACTASLDRSGMTSIDQLVGRSWRVVLPALGPQASADRPSPSPST